MLNIDFERKSRKLEYLSSTLAKETVSLERKMLQRNNQEIAVAPTKTAKLIKKKLPYWKQRSCHRCRYQLLWRQTLSSLWRWEISVRRKFPYPLGCVCHCRLCWQISQLWTQWRCCSTSCSSSSDQAKITVETLLGVKLLQHLSVWDLASDPSSRRCLPPQKAWLRNFLL